MFYTISLFRSNFHMFTTNKASIQDENKLSDVIGMLRIKFPSNEGYKLEIIRYEETGYLMDTITLKDIED